MNLDLSRNPEKALLLFTKVYIYTTNTKKPWIELTPKQRNAKNFEWYCPKWFFLSKKPLSQLGVIKHIKTCPELVESADNILKNNAQVDKKWKHKSFWCDIYPFYPLRDEKDLKTVINTIGVRMLHFVNN